MLANVNKRLCAMLAELNQSAVLGVAAINYIQASGRGSIFHLPLDFQEIDQ